MVLEYYRFVMSYFEMGYWTSLTKNIRNHLTVVKIILKGNFIFTHSGYLNQDETLHAVIPIK